MVNKVLCVPIWFEDVYNISKHTSRALAQCIRQENRVYTRWFIRWTLPQGTFNRSLWIDGRANRQERQLQGIALTARDGKTEMVAVVLSESGSRQSSRVESWKRMCTAQEKQGPWRRHSHLWIQCPKQSERETPWHFSSSLAYTSRCCLPLAGPNWKCNFELLAP